MVMDRSLANSVAAECEDYFERSALASLQVADHAEAKMEIPTGGLGVARAN